MISIGRDTAKEKKYMVIKDEKPSCGRIWEITTDTYIFLMYMYSTGKST